jgi:hypothetical protein
MAIAHTFNALSDDQLLDEMQRLVATERRAIADVLRALMEVDTRQLHLREGCSSLFTYCTRVLHLEESAAYNRIEVIRAARRIPALLEAVADGSLTLTSARLLAPHLTIENHTALLRAAHHRSKRDVEVLVASLGPQPAVPTVLRKVAAKSSVDAASVASRAITSPTASIATTACAPAAGHDAPAPSPRDVGVEPRRAHTSVVAPLSAGTYKLQVTISSATHDKLQRARDLLRHAIPAGDVAKILDRALTLLLEDVEKRRCAAVATPREGAPLEGYTRHIPAAVKREVWRRDAGRCAYSRGGRRCTETAFLEFHHVVPYGDGGPATPGNVELRCRAHNQYEAALLFGDARDIVREHPETNREL